MRAKGAKAEFFTDGYKFPTVIKVKDFSEYCPRCKIKSRCTTGDYRRVSRYDHEPVLEAIQDRLDREPERMRVWRFLHPDPQLF